MSYVQKVLLPGEEIVYSTKQHYVIFFQVLLWPILIACMLKVNYSNTLILGSLFLVMIFNFITVLIGYYCSEYAVTSQRIIMKVGFISRRSLEIFLDRVEGVYVEQSVAGRFLNFGTVIVIGVGSTKNFFPYTPNPLKFHGKIQEILQTVNSGAK